MADVFILGTYCIVLADVFILGTCCRVLADVFNLDDHKDNLKTGIVMDLFFYTLQFARDNNFTKEKTSAFFSIVKKTHEVCIGKGTRELF